MIGFSEFDTVAEVLNLPCFLILSGHLTRVAEENHSENRIAGVPALILTWHIQNMAGIAQSL
jgi:hypothetical protein